MKRAVQRADSALDLIDELLSGGQVQRSERPKLLRIRRELIELRKECDVGKYDVGVLALRWATVISKLLELLSKWL